MTKIKNYNNFLLESIRSILESYMTGSNDLLKVLYKIINRDRYSNSSDIANTLFAMLRGDRDIKTNFNLLGLSDKNDEIGFIPDTQYQKGFANGTDFSTKTKSKTKVGRMIRQLLSDNGFRYSDKDIEDFVNKFKASWDSFNGVDRSIKIVKGKDILHWYSSDNYSSNSGTLGNSCMKSPAKNDYMELYSDNENCQMVILVNNDGLLARALLWKIKDGSRYEYFLDRIYAINDSDHEFILNWVIENVVDGDRGKIGIQKKGDDSNLHMECLLNKTDFEEYPYADTMYYIYKEIGSDGKPNGTGFIGNFRDSSYYDKYIVYQLLNTNGTVDDISHRFSNAEGKYILLEEACYINEVEDWFSRSNCYYSDFTLLWSLKENSIWSEKQNSWFNKKDVVDHPKFGIVFRSSLVHAIMEYTGKSDNPFDIANELTNVTSDDTDLFRVEEMLTTDGDVFKADYTPNSDYRWFGDKLMASDVSNRFFPDFLAFKLYEVVDSDLLPDTFFVKHLSQYYILKTSSKIFNVEVSDSKLDETYAYFYNVKMLASVYKELPNLDKSDKDVIEYSKTITQIHKYLITSNSSYRRGYANFIIVESLKDKYDFIVRLGEKSFKEYLQEYNEYLSDDMEDYGLSSNENSLNLLRIISIIYLVSRDSHRAADQLEDYLDRIDKPESARTIRDVKYLFDSVVSSNFLNIFDKVFTEAVEKLDTGSQLGEGDINSDEFRDHIIRDIDYSKLFDKLVY